MLYRVTRTWQVTEVYEITATSKEEAKNKVSSGDGYLVTEDWDMLETEVEPVGKFKLAKS